MAKSGTRDSGNFWASVGMGLVVGLIIVFVVFRFTAPDDANAEPSGTPTITVLDSTSSAAASGTPTVPNVPTASSVPNPDGVDNGATATPDPGTGSSEPTEPTVTVTRSMGSCKYGPKCLIAGFTISGFPTNPPEYVCEFQDGSRYTISFQGTSVDNACSTATVPGSITVEVNGVRSQTITNP